MGFRTQTTQTASHSLLEVNSHQPRCFARIPEYCIRLPVQSRARAATTAQRGRQCQYPVPTAPSPLSHTRCPMPPAEDVLRCVRPALSLVLLALSYPIRFDIVAGFSQI